MSVDNLHQLQSLLGNQGIRTAYVKRLAPKQDNEKNQIYLGRGLDSITNLFPATIAIRSPSESKAKRGSKTGQPKLEARLHFAWLDGKEARHPAPDARIIDYFQYPEIRFSGFLKGCRQGPDSLRRRFQTGFGQRFLVMGTARDGTVLGLVLTERDDPIARDFPELPSYGDSGVFSILAIDGDAGLDPKEMLRAEIGAVVTAGWHPSTIMKADGPKPFRGGQGAGYTLEALLGVAANAAKEPDKHGFEIKSYTGSRISLMTPTPDRGYQSEQSFRAFMERFGRPAVKDDGSQRFVGLFRAGRPNERHGLVLRVSGYDPDTDTFSNNVEEIAAEIVSPETGEVAAGWSLERLANSWNRKHASAVYIRAEKNPEPADPDRDEYRYLAPWLVGEGTDVWKLLRAIAAGYVFYDPADTIYADGRAKVRSQWRVNTRDLKGLMVLLYGRVSDVSP